MSKHGRARQRLCPIGSAPGRFSAALGPFPPLPRATWLQRRQPCSAAHRTARRAAWLRAVLAVRGERKSCHRVSAHNDTSYTILSQGQPAQDRRDSSTIARQAERTRDQGDNRTKGRRKSENARRSRGRQWETASPEGLGTKGCGPESVGSLRFVQWERGSAHSRTPAPHHREVHGLRTRVRHSEADAGGAGGAI